MTENDPDRALSYDSEQPDLEEPDDGRDSQPPAEGSSDNPESLESSDPLRDHEAVLTETDGQTTLTGQQAEPTREDDWALEEEQIVDDEALEELTDEDLE